MHVWLRVLRCVCVCVCVRARGSFTSTCLHQPVRHVTIKTPPPECLMSLSVELQAALRPGLSTRGRSQAADTPLSSLGSLPLMQMILEPFFKYVNEVIHNLTLHMPFKLIFYAIFSQTEESFLIIYCLGLKWQVCRYGI